MARISFEEFSAGQPVKSTIQKPISTPQEGGGFVNTLKDVPSDIFEFGTGTQNILKERGTGFLNAFRAGRQGQQTPIETGFQMGAQPVLAAGDIAFEGVKTLIKPFLSPAAERGTEEMVSSAIQKTGITDWYGSLSDRTKRNIDVALAPLDLLGLKVGGATAGVTRTVLKDAKKTVENTLEDVFKRAETGDISDANKVIKETLNETERQKAVDTLAKAYEESLVENRKAINNRLKSVAESQSYGDVVVTPESLIKGLADEGIVPDVKNRLADFSADIRRLDQRQTELMRTLQPLIDQSKATKTIDDFYAEARKAVLSNPRISSQSGKALRELDEIFASYRLKYPEGKLTANDINNIKIEANQRRIDYNKSVQGDPFITDTYSTLARLTNEWLNKQIPDDLFKQANAEYSRLQKLKETADILDSEQIDVGIIGRALGSYVNTITGSMVGLVTGGPVTSLAAGILTKVGGDALADMIRKYKFSPELRAKLQERLSTDQALKKQLIETATTLANRQEIERLSRTLPPSPPGAPRSQVSSGAPIRVGNQGASAPVGQIVETARPGAIKVPEGEGRPLPRSMYPEISDADLQKLKTSEFRKLLDKVGANPDDLEKAFIGGTIGYLLMTYIGEDGELLPAFGVVLGVASSRGGRLSMLDDAIKANMARRDALSAAGKTHNDPQIKALDKQYKALARERHKVVQSLSPGLGIEDVSGKAQSATTKTTDLLEEAKGKTLDEFVKAKTEPSDYGYSHRPTEGPRAFNLTEKVDGEQMIPSDMYSQWYGSRGTPEDIESINALKKIKGNPEAEVTIYRASPSTDFNYGDWVTLSKKYAKQHAESNGDKTFKVNELKVKAKDIRWAMDDVNEFGYYPENYKSQLEDIWNKANNPSPTSGLEAEARKYKTAEEFVKAQGTPLYHGGNKVTDIKLGKDSFTGKPVGFSTTPDKSFAERYSQQISRDGEVTEIYLKPNAKILDKTEAGIDPHIDPTYSADANLIKDAIEQGYDAVRMRVTAPGGLNEGTSIELQILNPDAVKTKAQLEDIWKQANGKTVSTDLLEEAKIELQLNNLDPKNFNTVDEFISAYNKKPVLKSNIDLQKLNDTETKTVGDVLRGELKNKYKNVADVRIETVTPGSFYDADLAKNVKGQIVLLDNNELVILMRSDVPVSKMREILLEEIDHAATYKRNPEFITRDAVVANKGTDQEYLKLPSEKAAKANVEKRLLESRYTQKELTDIWNRANGKTGSSALLEEAKKIPSGLQNKIDDALFYFAKSSKKPFTTSKPLWRGQGAEGGTGGADFGKGLYFSTNKKLAGQYGDLREISPDNLPQNPLRFDSSTQYEGFLATLKKALGKKSEADYNGDYGELIRAIGDYDGVVVGDGSIIVKYPENAPKMTPEQLTKLWEETNR